MSKCGGLEGQKVTDSVGGCGCGIHLFVVGVGWSSGTGRVCGRPQVRLLECDPTILAREGVAGQWQE